MWISSKHKTIIARDVRFLEEISDVFNDSPILNELTSGNTRLKIKVFPKILRPNTPSWFPLILQQFLHRLFLLALHVNLKYNAKNPNEHLEVPDYFAPEPENDPENCLDLRYRRGKLKKI